MCRVAECTRRAAVSVGREDVPGPIRLCATHTEGFRLNGAHWSVVADPAGNGASWMVPAPLPPVGRSSTSPAPGPLPGGSDRRLMSRMSAWFGRRS